MFRKSISVVLFILGTLAASSSYAQFNFTSCLVAEVVASGDTVGIITLDCQIENMPACSTVTNYLGFDKSTQEGKDYFQMALIALETRAKVTGVVHANSCFHGMPQLNQLRVVR